MAIQVTVVHTKILGVLNLSANVLTVVFAHWEPVI